MFAVRSSASYEIGMRWGGIKVKKVVGLIALTVVLAIPVRAQSFELLENLMKAVVQEYGIEKVIAVLTELGYIDIGNVEKSVKPVELSQTDASELTGRSPIWDDPAGEETLVYMVVSDDSKCYDYLDWGRGTHFSLTERMKWRQVFINRCIGR